MIGRPGIARRRPPFGAPFAAVPVRTRLVHPGEDVAQIVSEAVAGIARPGDVIAVSETAVAIAQGRAIAAETIRPSRLAYLLSARAGPMATVSQPESLQLVIDRAGAWRVLLAAAAHLAGCALGRRGMFYRVLGGAVGEIDGYTGTLPPFQRTIVLGPLEPAAVAARIAERTGAHAAIVDANDLGTPKILGASPGVAIAALARALVRNPHGNGDEQTPVVVFKWRRAEPNPLEAA